MTGITIAIDAMGGDHGLKTTLPASLRSLQNHADLRLILVGDQTLIEGELKNLAAEKFIQNGRLKIEHASETVAMGEAPSKALRNKKDSSMRVALNLVKDGVAAAAVSAGNTGALMATARYVLKMIPGVDRPAIVGTLPTVIAGREVRLLDLGANVNSSAADLYQYAVMASVLANSLSNIALPKVALLNIGSEEIKGNDLVKEAAQLFAASPFINYLGYIEGDDIFKGEVDVVVCDGFVGNVALKAMEGIIKLVLHYAKEIFFKNIFTKMAVFVIMPLLKKLYRTIDPDRRNGASLLGLRGIVVKSHGSANQKAFANAIFEAALQVKQNIPQKIHEKVALFLAEPKEGNVSCNIP